jgi:hypothetical protein
MEEKRGASQGIGDQKAAIRTKSSLGLHCQLLGIYIQVRTSMTNSPSNRLVKRLVSLSVSKLVSVSDQSWYSKAISQPVSHPSLYSKAVGQPMSHLRHRMSNRTGSRDRVQSRSRKCLEPHLSPSQRWSLSVRDVWGRVWAFDKGARGVLLRARPCLRFDRSQVVWLVLPRSRLLLLASFSPLPFWFDRR